MRRILTLAAAAAFAPLALHAQMAPRADLPPIPAARTFAHWGSIESDFDEEEKSTSLSLTLPFTDKQRGAFVRRGNARDVSLSAGFVYSGRTMTSYPDFVTVVLKITRATETALRGDRQGTGDITFELEGGTPIALAAPLVGRNGLDTDASGRPRKVEDTYIVVLSLSQFLRLVDADGVSAQLRDMKLDLNGGPIEGMRDLASRIVIAR